MDDQSETQDIIRNRRLEKLRFWRRACADESATLKLYNTEQAGNPLIFLHGDYEMGGFYMNRVASECNYPIAALAPHGLQGEEIRPSIEWMAQERLKDILAFRPQGPYRLGGYCNGALVAFEAARLLKTMGHEIEFVVLVEPAAMNVRQAYRLLHRAVAAFLPSAEKRSTVTQQRFGLAMNGCWNIGRILRLALRDTGRSIGELAGLPASRRKRLAAEALANSPAERAVREKSAHFKYVYSAATASYLPRRTTVPLVVLSTGLDHSGRRCGLYDGIQWRHIARSFRHIQLPGHHLSCLSSHVDELASKLGAILRAPPTPPSQMPPRLERQKFQAAGRPV